MTVTDHTNYITPADVPAVETARCALDWAREGDVDQAAQLGGITVAQATTLGDGLRASMRFTSASKPMTIPEPPQKHRP